MDYLSETKKFYRRHVSRFRKPKGCGPELIENLEKEIGFRLPEAYKQFLQWMGCDFNGIFVGSDIFLRDVIPNTKYLPQLLKENELDHDLPEKYLAFFSHQGYVMAWFALPKESENPPVWFWGEGQRLSKPIKFESFTDFLSEQMRSLVMHY